MQSWRLFLNAEVYLMREDLLMHSQYKLIVNILLENLLEFNFSLILFSILNFVLWQLNQIDNIIANMNRGMNERGLFIQSIVVPIH